MPFDPFFTSSGRDTDKEDREIRKAIAKSRQFHGHVKFLNRQKRQKALRNATRDCAAGRAIRDNVVTLSSQQHAAVSGFKQPKRVWQHRNSEAPKGKEII